MNEAHDRLTDGDWVLFPLHASFEIFGRISLGSCLHMFPRKTFLRIFIFDLLNMVAIRCK